MRAFAAVLGLLLSSTAYAHKPTTTTFSYHRDVYPIVLEKCGACHRPGGVGPMSLLSYETTFPWAVAIKNEVLALRMPPWYADERVGAFQHRQALTASEVNTLVDWCIGGTPEGDPPDSAPPAAEPGWRLGEPDLVLEMAEPALLASDVSERVQDFLLPARLSRERFLKGLDVLPGSPNVVRSAVVFKDRAVPKNVVAAWVPGEEAESFPEGRGVHLPKGTSFVLRLHYKKTWLDEGKEVSDRSRLGLYFRKDERVSPVASVVVAPAGGESFSSSDTGFQSEFLGNLPAGGEVLALLPWVGARLTSLHAEALLPGGGVVDLIRLREPHPDFPRKFWLERPVSLPPKSRIRVTVTAPDETAIRKAHVLVLDVVRQ